jgi:hypothetical protein
MNDIMSLVSKYRGLIVGLTLLSVAVFAAAALTLPKRYKAYFVMTIYSNYFQNPLIRDFTTEIYDATEMRSQRESLIRQTLTPEFLDSLGEKYGIYTPRKPGLLHRLSSFLGEKYGVYLNMREMRTRSEERKFLLSGIQILNLKSDTFQIGFMYSDPDVTYRIVQDLHTQVTQGLVNVRRTNLEATRGAIQKRLESLAQRLPSLDAPTSAASAVPSAEAPTPPVVMVDEELSDVRSQLRILTARYTDEHPLVRELRDKERSLMALSPPSVSRSAGPGEKSMAVRIPQDAAQEIYKDLTKKLNYLNVSLDSDASHSGDAVATLESPLYPVTPLWPKKGLFLLWGVALGLLGSLFIAAIREYFDRSVLRSPILAEQLGVPVLGEIPRISWGAISPAAYRNGASQERPIPRH